ncbi:MAG TPA: MarR family transcriptional regulator [Caulobacteraceae bacterium]|nr:MarR family transcriptional regulator [Caulobacteraceae bacterium]
MAFDPGRFRGLSGFRYAMRRFVAASERLSREAGVTQQQYQALLAIKVREGGAMTISDLAEQLMLTHHAAVQMMNRLAKAGLAARRRSERDRRLALLDLTDAGEALIEDLAGKHLDEILRHEPLLRRSLNQLKRLGSDSPPRFSSR